MHDNQTASWDISATVDGQEVSCAYHLFNWHRLMAGYHERSLIQRFIYGMVRYLKLFCSQTPIAYFKANWRYGLFFLYPALLLIGLLLAAFFASDLIASIIGFGQSMFLCTLLMAVIFLTLMKYIGKPWHLFLMLDDWAFAYDMMHSQNQEFEDKIAEFAKQLEAHIVQSDADEILISGHSFGAIFAIYSLSQMLEAGKVKKPIVILTAASSILKIAFAKKATWLRDALQKVLAQKSINWVEFFVINDPICFYKSKPDRALRLEAVNPIQFYRVRFQETLNRARFKRISTNFFRIHRQILLANDKPYFYDYYAYISFPLPVLDWLTIEGRENLPITKDVKTIKERKHIAEKDKETE